jgi:hypothetical protein
MQVPPVQLELKGFGSPATAFTVTAGALNPAPISAPKRG